MKIYDNPSREYWEEICRRPSGSSELIRERVSAILERVRLYGDTALRELSLEIDGRECGALEVSKDEIAASEAKVNPGLKAAISSAASNIRAFHSAQIPQKIEVTTAPGVRCIQKPVPIRKVGLYIPGGTAPLFSTVLMLAIPAKLAGCSEIVLCSPAGKDGGIAPAVLYAASVCGVDRIFRIGGAQAIAAMAYGTRTVPGVDKIFGPGNQYVTTAKQMLSAGTVAIDMPAGPSEVMVVMDDTTDPAYAAADLLSQAEHGRDSQVVLLCSDTGQAEAVKEEIIRQTACLGRADLAEAALGNSFLVAFSSQENMIDFANRYAPEHLIVSTAEPWKFTERIYAAGSVFIGKWTPESAGDYASGTNHTLPTCGWARSFSGVNMDSFIRKMTIQEISREGLEGIAGTIVTMAEAEGLQAHANAVKIRTNE